MQDPIPDPVTGFRRYLWLGSGLSFTALAFLGALLPILPTTPFLLLAAWCFAKSSPRLHRWLLESRLFGPLIRDWQRHRGVRLHVKVTAVGVVLAGVSASLYFGNLSLPLQVMLLVLAAVGLSVVIRLPLIRE